MAIYLSSYPGSDVNDRVKHQVMSAGDGCASPITVLSDPDRKKVLSLSAYVPFVKHTIYNFSVWLGRGIFATHLEVKK